MLKNKNIIRYVAMILIITVCLSCVCVYAKADMKEQVVYSSNIADGKVFTNGENIPVMNKNQFDTSISDIILLKTNSSYLLCFNYGTDTFIIEGNFVKAKANNVDNDHYYFAPSTQSIGKFSFLNIGFTTSANEYDLLPANSDLIGETVISIKLYGPNHSDVYYWQTSLTKPLRSVAHVISTSSNEEDIKIANEFYYVNQSKIVDCCTESDFPTEDIASEQEYEYYKTCDIKRTYTNNPYYNLGIPDSTFKTATDSWRWLAVGRDEYGNYLPIRYYAYSYTLYGNPNIMTHIMIVGHTWQRDDNIDDYYSDGNNRYSKISAMLKIELFKQPQTVVYYTGNNTFDFMPGGENLTQIDEPGIEIEKTSTGVPHVVVGRYEFSNATKKGGFLGFGSLVLKDVLVGVLDSSTYGIASSMINILNMISDASMSVGAQDGIAAIEEYYSSFSVQESAYGHAMGSVKSTIKGYLRDAHQYYGTRVWFATPYANRSSVKSVRWIYYVSPAFR